MDAMQRLGQHRRFHDVIALVIGDDGGDGAANGAVHGTSRLR